jgi:hypothetical protein
LCPFAATAEDRRVKARLHDFLGYPAEVIDLPPGCVPRVVVRGDKAYVRREESGVHTMGVVDYDEATCWVCPDTLDLGKLGD